MSTIPNLNTVHILKFSTGIGRMVVRTLIKRGCNHVDCLDVNQDLLDEIKLEVRPLSK